MTDQQTLPGLEPQYPYNTPAGRWMLKRGWMWDAQYELWFLQIPIGSPLASKPVDDRLMSHKDATKLYFETDEPPF